MGAKWTWTSLIRSKECNRIIICEIDGFSLTMVGAADNEEYYERIVHNNATLCAHWKYKVNQSRSKKIGISTAHLVPQNP